MTARKKKAGRKAGAPRRRAKAAAVATKKVGFKFTGAWDEWGAAVDDSDPLASPDDSRNLPAGTSHTLSWAITGRPGAAYTVSIAGCSPKDWSRDFQIGDDGRGIGSHSFKVAA